MSKSRLSQSTIELSDSIKFITGNILNNQIISYSIKIGLVIYIVAYNKTSILPNNPFIRLIIVSLIILFTTHDPTISLLGTTAFLLSVNHTKSRESFNRLVPLMRELSLAIEIDTKRGTPVYSKARQTVSDQPVHAKNEANLKYSCDWSTGTCIPDENSKLSHAECSKTCVNMCSKPLQGASSGKVTRCKQDDRCILWEQSMAEALENPTKCQTFWPAGAVVCFENEDLMNNPYVVENSKMKNGTTDYEALCKKFGAVSAEKSNVSSCYRWNTAWCPKNQKRPCVKGNKCQSGDKCANELAFEIPILKAPENKCPRCITTTSLSGEKGRICDWYIDETTTEDTDCYKYCKCNEGCLSTSTTTGKSSCETNKNELNIPNTNKPRPDEFRSTCACLKNKYKNKYTFKYCSGKRKT